MSLRNRIPTLLLVFLALSSVSFAQIPRSRHVYVVAEENRSYEHIVGSADMPFLNGLLAQNGLATEFYSNQHSSLPNYFWLTAGQQVTLDDDTNATYDVDNIVRRLMKAGLSYKSYAQSIPNPGFADMYYNAYMKRHAILPWYVDMGGRTGAQDPTDARRWLVDLKAQMPAEMAKHVEMNQWLADVASGNLPNFAFITPDGDHDMHNCDTVPLSTCLQIADQFLKDNLTPLLTGPEFQPGGDGLLIIWADEADLDGIDDRCSATIKTGCGGHIVVAMIGPNVKQGYKSTTTYHHEHVLRTMMDALGLPGPYPGAADSVSNMAEFFKPPIASPASAPGTPDFAIAPATSTSTNKTVAPGQSANYSLTVNAISGFSGSLALTCFDLPTGANCSFDPGSVNLAGNTTNLNVVITTAPHSSSGILALPFGFAGSLAALLLFAPMRYTRKIRWSGLSVLALGLGISFITGCGGGGTSLAPTPVRAPVTTSSQSGGTPAGSYTVTVAATSNSGQTRTSTLSLTVQ